MCDALEWLTKRNGEGTFDKTGVLLAAGERAPFMRVTWNRLRAIGKVEIWKPHRTGAARCKVLP